jgi:hypothetical protein
MNLRKRIYSITVAALLCAIGILIPIFSPVKILLEPASFTLASHVAIFIAMFISPITAVFVALGTTLGFFFAGIFPPVVIARAASHVVFATIGAIIIKRNPAIIDSFKKSTVLALGLSLIHAVCEVLVVLPFYFFNLMSAANYNKGFFISVILLVGVGTIVHSMIDFYIAYAIWRPIKKSVASKITADR